MPTFDANILPSATGQDLGSTDYRWDVFSQNADVSGDLAVAGNLTVDGTTTLTDLGASALTHKLTIETSDSNPLLVQQTADVDGITVTPSADGQTSTGMGITNAGNTVWKWKVDKSGNETVGGTLAVTGNATLGGTLGVTGNTTLGGTLGVTGNATMSGTLGVTGAITASGGVTGAHNGTVGETTPNTGAFTTLTSKPVATASNYNVSVTPSVNITPVTVNANSTSAQNLMSYSVPAGMLNAVGKTLKIKCKGLWTTQSAQTPTLTLAVTLGGVSMVSTFSTALTAAVTNAPWSAEYYLTCASTGASGTIEAHGEFVIATGGATANMFRFGDVNAAVSSAVNLTTAQTLQITATFSTNASPSNAITQRTMIVELCN